MTSDATDHGGLATALQKSTSCTLPLLATEG